MKLRNSKKKGVIKAANAFQPWDFSFLLELEYQSLKVMLEYYKDRTIVKYIKLAISLLDITLEIDSSLHYKGREPYLYRYINTKNWKRFMSVEPDNIWLKDMLRIEKAWYLYNLLRYRVLRIIWD